MLEDIENPSSFFFPGTLVNERYCIKEFIGSGGSGFVLLATDTQIQDDPLVLKLLYPHLMQDERAYQRFRKETSVALELSHPNIVQTFGIEPWRGVGYFIAMEYMSGGSLKELLDAQEGQEVGFGNLLQYLNQVVNGLSYAHDRGVVHRDIKPHNLLLGAAGEVKVADFGLSQMLWGEVAITHAGDVLGTPQYMSPEQLEAKAIDLRSDIYSLGITAYELAYGCLPFVADTLFELATCHLEHPIPKQTEVQKLEIPAWFHEFLERCTEKKREDRFNNMVEVAQVLREQMGEDWIQVTTGVVTAPRLEDRTTRALNRRFFKEMWKYQAILYLSIFALIVFGLARTKVPLNRRIATQILKLEQLLGSELPRLKATFSIQVKFGDKAAFFDQKLTRKSLFPLLEAGMSPNFLHKAWKEDGEVTPLLFWARYPNAIGSVKKLLEYGADVNARDIDGRTPLMRAIRSGGREKEVAITLMNAGSDIEASDKKGMRAIHYSVELALPVLTKELIDRGVDINTQDNRGDTALHYAVTERNEKAIAILLAAGVDQKIRNKQNYTAIDLANRLPSSNPDTARIITLLNPN